MSKFIECDNLTELEDKAEELYDIYNHVEFVRWHNDNIAEFFCE